MDFVILKKYTPFNAKNSTRAQSSNFDRDIGMNIVAVGISHKNTPLEIREKFSLTETQQDLLLSELKNDPSVAEAFVFSTCNRVEVYANVLDAPKAFDVIRRLLFNVKKLGYSDELAKYFYCHRDKTAVEHLLRVTAGLDSMMLGEKQILGQAKAAFERARTQGMFTKCFHLLSNTAIRVGKKARHETDLGVGGSSVSWAAIAQAERELGSLQDKSILIIGAGKMSDLAVGHIHNKGFRQLYLMNRTPANAEDLAEKYSGTVVPFCDIKEVLAKVDVCICSVGAPHYILDKDTVEKVMPLRSRRRLVFIDISVPRNIDPLVAQVEDVQLFQLDDLQEVVGANMELRRQSVRAVETIVQNKVAEFFVKLARNTSSDGRDDHSEDSELLADV